MKQTNLNPLLALGLCVGLSNAASAQSDSATVVNDPDANDAIELERVTITGDADERESTPGSVTSIESESLEQWNFEDIHRVLDEAPGVYVRQEDGWGLRPNIGIRGASSDRSRKIALAEDGILIAPAPYSAPAAYYFPILSRIQAVEVFKGPSAIKNGPNTVGGVVNLVSRTIPGSEDEEDLNGALGVELGNFGFKKLHAYYGKSEETWGALLEGVKLQADGFQQLDNGGDSGFDKNDLLFKYRWNSDFAAENYHQFDFKIGYADEVSDQSYLGLTNADFADNPLRRYTAGELDQFTWDHQQFSLSHYFDPGGDYTLDTTVYYRAFDRVWDRLNGFADGGPALTTILANPDTPVNSIFIDVLRGDRDSSNSSETLLLTSNDRTFFSRGAQIEAEFLKDFDSSSHEIDIGVRLHQDQVERLHTEAGYVVQEGALQRNANPGQTTTSNRGESTALAFYVQDKVELDRLTVSGGVRVELINSQFTDNLAQVVKERDQEVLIPGIGFNYLATSNLRLLAGVHKGFVPATPENEPEVKAEESVNYEFGLRYNSSDWKGELIGFFNDYSNLAGTCTFSSGCATSLLDLGFNAGEVNIYGVEASVSKLFAFGSASPTRIPVQLSWTYTTSEVQNNFTSPSPDLLDVSVGDELPYLPEQQISLQAGLQRFDFSAALAVKYVSSMRTIAGQDAPTFGERTQSYTVVDLSANYQFSERQQAYITAQNLFDKQAVSARRPFGARGIKPASVVLGYKLDF